jgi:hypothetical protein
MVAGFGFRTINRRNRAWCLCRVPRRCVLRKIVRGRVLRLGFDCWIACGVVGRTPLGVADNDYQLSLGSGRHRFWGMFHRAFWPNQYPRWDGRPVVRRICGGSSHSGPRNNRGSTVPAWVNPPESEIRIGEVLIDLSGMRNRGKTTPASALIKT